MSENESPAIERELQRDILVQWMKERFDKVDVDNKDIKTELSAVHKTVNRHSIYWDIVKYGVPISAATVLGWLGFGPKH